MQNRGVTFQQGGMFTNVSGRGKRLASRAGSREPPRVLTLILPAAWLTSTNPVSLARLASNLAAGSRAQARR